VTHPAAWLALGPAATIAVAVVSLALFAAVTARRVEAAVPPLGDFLDVDGARVHYVDRGSGPATLVMIHGLGGNLRNFTQALVDRLDGEFRVVVVDRPGSGYSERAPGASPGIDADAATVAGVVRALGLERPVLVGHSLGGAVALAVALDHPELVGGLALVAPLTHVIDAPPAAFARLAIASPLVRRLVAWTVASPTAILGSRAVLAMIFAPDPVPPDFGTEGGGLLGVRPQAFMETSADLLAVNDSLPGIVARYATLRLPVGIVFGTGDRILDHRVHGVSMTGIVEGLRLDLIDGGHMLPITAADRVAALVRDVAERAREAVTAPALAP
jgi:pimeloyl-ACP methyl ester carboxylesterase